MRLLMVIPAYNEEASLERVVDDLVRRYPQYDYVIVNDGSRDRTAQICRERNYRMVDLAVNTGLSYAFQTGLKLAWEQGYDCAMQFDADGQHDAEYIEAMLETMEREKADIVIGSRFVTKKKPFNARMIGNRLIQWTIRMTTGQNLTDPTSGMRMLNRSMICEFANHMNYGPEPDTIAYLLNHGIKVSEVQVEMHERQAGTSYLNLVSSMRYMLRMFISILLFQNFRKREVS